jgi:predicted PurR-regulated permease PerM
VLTVVAVLLVLYAAYLVRSVLLLALVAGFLAVGLDPAVTWVEKRLGLRRGQAVTIIVLLFILTIVGFLAAVVPPLVRQVAEFATNLPEYIQELAQRNERLEEFVNSRDIATRLREATSNLPSTIGGSLGTVVGVAGSVLTTIFSSLTVLVLTIYFSINLQSIREGTFKLVPRSKRHRVQELADPVLTKIGGYIAGNITISVIAGVLSFVFLIIAGVPFPVALALWVAIADLIPMVGATLGAIPAVIVAAFTSLPLGIATLVFFVIYQQFENYVVAPRVMTKAVDLSPAAVLLSALIGGALLGVVGVLMAIPLAAGMKLLVQELVIPEADRA